ncbi:Zinc finger C2H2-type [Trinorchestia longiramus]|nr:Zinc finger C2H2-type [Trinorchestia longiramus]
MKHAGVLVHKLTDTEVKRQCCSHDFIKQEDEVENLEYVAPPNPANPPAAMIIKSEVPDGELDDVTVKEEPIDWDQEPQVSSNAVSSTLTMKREDEVCAGARSGHAEADDKLQEGSSGACNTSAVHQRSAAASQEGADSVPSQVSGAIRSVRYLQNCQVPAEVSGTNRDVEVEPGRCQKFLCELCDYSTNRKNNLTVHLAGRHKLGVFLECEFCDYTCAQNNQLKVHLGNKHNIGKKLKCELCEYSTASIRKLVDMKWTEEFDDVCVNEILRQEAVASLEIRMERRCIEEDSGMRYLVGLDEECNMAVVDAMKDFLVHAWIK